MYALLSGVVAALTFVAAIAFLRSFVRTRDRFFLYFAAAFIIFGITQVALGITNSPEVNHPAIYVPRLVTSLLILAAIWDKNRSSRARPPLEAPADLETYQRRRAAL
ncbi:MAG TPA: DUF5985 family protein [Candidatus Baltobacteraceae bacterium]|jgi:peptidoglycan/LPS O-acetylase OafA/YrhL